MYKHILMAVDDSETSYRALHEAAVLARDAHALLRLVYVVDRVALLGAAQTTDAADSEAEWRRIGDRILRRAQEAAGAAGVTAETQLLQTEDVEDRVAQAITGEATRWSADMLVAGTHGRTGLRHLLMGSVAEGIVRYSPVPVLLVRADDVERKPLESE